MPLSHQPTVIEPEVFLEHAGFKVYYIYPDNDFGQLREDYLYAFVDDCDEAFDVRELPNWRGCPHPAYTDMASYEKSGAATAMTFERWVAERKREWDAWHNDKVLEAHSRQILKAAIDLGYLTPERNDISELYDPHISVVCTYGEVVTFRASLRYKHGDRDGAGDMVYEMRITNDIPGWLGLLNLFIDYSSAAARAALGPTSREVDAQGREIAHVSR